MIGIVMVVVGIALLLIALAFIDHTPLGKRNTPTHDPSIMDQVRDAAFAVVEASLEGEPEKWKVILDEDNKIDCIVCPEHRVAIRMYMGVTGLYVRIGCHFLEDGAPYDGEKFTPPMYMRTRIYNAALKLSEPQQEKQEADKLQKMVAAFGSIIDRNNHDQKAA